MKSIRWLLILLIILILLPWTLRAQGLLPNGRPEFEFLYDQLERTDALTLDTAPYQLGPYSLNLASGALGPFTWLNDLNPSELRFLGHFGENFRSAKHASAQSYESLHGALAARPLAHVFVYGSFSLDESLANDPAYSGKKWRGLAGDIDNAFINLQTGNLNLTLGRFASFWGPRHSLVLGPDTPMDGLGYSYRWGRLVLSYRLARLDSLDPDTDSVTQFENRYFAAHRLDVHLSRRLRIGFFESAIFGGPGRQIELYYLNPIIFFHASQLNDGVDDNTFLGFDFSLEPGGNVKLYGQLLVDDFQVDDKTQSDQEPNELALLAGTYVADIFPNVDIRAEYTRVSNRTFNQSHTRNRYTCKSGLIGAADGNDYDLASVQMLKWLTPEIRTGLNLSHRRQGEGRVNRSWDTPWLETDGDYHEPFPTGTVEKTTTAALQFTGFLLNHVFLDFSVGIDRVNNFAHTGGDHRTLPFAEIRLITFASSRIRVD